MFEWKRRKTCLSEAKFDKSKDLLTTCGWTLFVLFLVLAAGLLCLKMAVYEVFSQAELIRYRASICSKATIAIIICVLLTFIPPFFIAYRTGDFWEKIGTYSEQPKVNFKYSYVATVNVETTFFTYSTYQTYNELYKANLKPPLVKSREDDLNGDGLNDQLDFSISFPCQSTEKVKEVNLMLMFSYVLQQYSYFQMESMVYISSSYLSGNAAKFDVTGSLSLAQTAPLGNSGIDTRYNTSVIDSTSLNPKAYQMSEILRKYSARNVTTVLTNVYSTWTGSRGPTENFEIRAVIRYPTQYGIIYYVRFWQMIKWGWVQYIAFLVLFWYILDKIEKFIFQNQLVTTIVQRPFKDKPL